MLYHSPWAVIRLAKVSPWIGSVGEKDFVRHDHVQHVGGRATVMSWSLVSF